MLLAFALFMAATDLVLALYAFVAFAKPVHLLGTMAWLTGQAGAWREGRLSGEERQSLCVLVERLRPLLLLVLFGWSFAAGALLVLVRL